MSACMIVLMACGLSSCQKFLDAKPDDRLSLPSTITDLQLLLDDYNTLNTQYPYAQELAADNFYLATDDWNTLNQLDRDIYSWQKNDQTLDRWTAAYQAVLSTNIVLENINIVPHSPGEQAAWNNVKGSALFFRAFYFYGIAQVYTLPYNSSSAAADWGIPLRLNADYTQVSVRSSQEQTYRQIITDLQQAISLLPVTPAIKSRPARPAAYALLARVYLDMQQYADAGAYADSCLQLYNHLIDYNTLDPTADDPFERFNDEVIFEALAPVADIAAALCRIDTPLYASYAANDLRREIYFSNNNGYTVFKGDYSGLGAARNLNIFTGIIADEMYLVKAESLARAANTTAAMQALNALLLTRWRTGAFVPLTAANPAEALQQILTERRKELLFRGARWSDLRRLKDDPQFSVTPVRIINGRQYELAPNSSRYALQLPRSVIEQTGMPQNP